MLIAIWREQNLRHPRTKEEAFLVVATTIRRTR